MLTIAKLLELFTEEYPPPAGCNHCITLPTSGSPEEAKLVLHLWVPDSLKVHIEEGDMDREAEELFHDIQRHLTRMGIDGTSTRPSPNAVSQG